MYQTSDIVENVPRNDSSEQSTHDESLLKMVLGNTPQKKRPLGRLGLKWENRVK